MLPAVDFWNWGRTLINDFDKVLIFSAKAGPSFGKSTRIKSCAAHQPFPYSALTSLTAVLVPPCTKEKKSSERLREILEAAKYTNTVAQKRRNPLKDCDNTQIQLHKREEILWKTVRNIGGGKIHKYSSTKEKKSSERLREILDGKIQKYSCTKEKKSSERLREILVAAKYFCTKTTTIISSL